MNGEMSKRLKKTLLTRTEDVLLLIRSEYGSKTESTETPTGVWRDFKRLYKAGKVPANLIVKWKGEVNGNNIEFKHRWV